jgi:membrane dipeptidase
MLIIDGDYPMAIGALHWDRDLSWDLERIRTSEPGTPKNGEWADAYTMASIPEMRKAEMAAALVKVCSCVKKPGHPHGEYRTQNLAYASSMGQLAYYQIMESTGDANILATREGFASHMEAWAGATDLSELPVGFIIGMEGADAIVWPEQVHEWYANGLRVISLSHYGVSAYSHGTATGTDGGLLPPGRPLLEEMDKLGMILDVSHTSDASVREELEIFTGPVLASHQNCRAVTPGERQQPDDILKAVIDRGGVIGASMDTWMIYKGGLDWSKDIPQPWEVFPRESVTLEDYVDHIDYVCQLAGNSEHAAIGGDTDGQGGVPEAPYEIDTIVDYQKVADVLSGRGYKHADIENIMYRNWQRFFEKWLPSEIG